ncbi:MAG: hypothetical protein QOD77_1160 [Thermoplasmata archaeon]|jgi:hypothetical protein|nr:hypothetical protein [Thermoplasmata archaeon]
MADEPPKPLQRELLVCLLLHLVAMAVGAAWTFLGCKDNCGEGTRMWTLIGGVTIFAVAATAAASELARSLAGTGDGWLRWAGLSMLTAALTAAALGFLARPPVPMVHAPLERGLAIILLAAASNALLSLVGAGVVRWARKRGEPQAP